MQSFFENRRREEALAKQQAFQEEQQNRRYEMQLKNQLELYGEQMRQKALQIASQKTQDWNKTQWNDRVKGYEKNLDQAETQLTQYLDPSKLWEKSAESIKQAQQILKWIPSQRQKVASNTPADWNEFRDATPLLEQFPVEFTPGESEESRKARLGKQELQDARLKQAETSTARTQQLIQKGNEPAAKKVDSSKLSKAATARANFLGATANFYNTYTGDDQSYTNTELDAGKFGKSQVAAAKAWTPQAQKFLMYASDPEVVGADVANIVRAVAPAHNNLASPADFHNMLLDLGKRDYSGADGKAAYETVTKLHRTFTDPTFDPFDDGGDGE